MYRGNIQEFINQLSKYCEENFKLRITISSKSYTPGIGYTVIPGRYELIVWKDISGVGFNVTDETNFEEQCYDVINKELKRLK